MCASTLDAAFLVPGGRVGRDERCHPLPHLLVVASVAAYDTSGSTYAHPRIEMAKPADPSSVANADVFEPTHYHCDFDIVFEEKRVSGTERLTVKKRVEHEANERKCALASSKNSSTKPNSSLQYGLLLCITLASEVF